MTTLPAKRKKFSLRKIQYSKNSAIFKYLSKVYDYNDKCIFFLMKVIIKNADVEFELYFLINGNETLQNLGDFKNC